MIKLQKVNKFYNKGGANQIRAINNTDLELPERGMVAIFGKSGCGKTTLLNAIGGLDSIDSGVITVFGQNIRENTDLVRNKYIGYIFQNYNLSKELSVYDNIANALILCGVTDEEVIRERVMAALSCVGMEKFYKRMPDALSGGQQQRVAIARAIVKNPSVILADEPTGNLDEANTIMVMDMLKEFSKDHLVLLVTHEAHLVDYYCDTVIEIVDGTVTSVRANSDANGYVQKDKNAIYLGELEKKTASVPGATIEYYGEEGAQINLKIVNVGGKLYLQTDSPNLMILDSTSETRLVEGVFTPEAKAESSKSIDMSKLPPIEGEKYGSLFGFKKSLKDAFTYNFTRKIRKSDKFLRVLLVMLAIILVFASARFAVFIRDFAEINVKHDPAIIYISATEASTLGLIDSVGEHGIEDMALCTENSCDTVSKLSFKPGNFISANISITAEGFYAPISSLADGNKTVLGCSELTDAYDMVITTAVADRILNNSPASYIDRYDDLIGLVSSGDSNYKIIGIVDSDILYFYVDDMNYYTRVVDTLYTGDTYVASSLSDVYKGELARGEIAIRMNQYDFKSESIQKDGTFTLAGRDYTIKHILFRYYYYDGYDQFLENMDYKIPSIEEYADGREIDLRLISEWYFEVFFEHLDEFIEASDINGWLEYEPWLLKQYPTEKWLYAFVSPSTEYFINDNGYIVETPPEVLAAAYLYRLEHGEYPDSVDEKAIDDAENRYKSIYESNYSLYDSYRNSFGYYYLYYQTQVVMNDEDYKALARTAAASSSTFGGWSIIDYYIGDYSNQNYYSRYYGDLLLKIRSSDVSETIAYLTDNYDGTIITPSDHLSSMLSTSFGSIIANSVSLIVIIALMGLFIFFIMRSSFLGRVKEVGIYRAIGVSKKNIKFKFLIETLLISTLTVLIGYILANILLYYVTSIFSLSSILYFPFWLAVLILAIVYAICVLFGLLPVSSLLHKTPSAILAKYDI